MLERIPLENKIISGKFDLVYSTFSQHHWQDPVREIRAMHRVLPDRDVLMLHDFKTGTP